jgi:hypothetical protein
LASLIVLSEFLFQRGAPHPRDPLKLKSRQKQRVEVGRFTYFYRHSLSLAFLLLFVLSLALHIVVGDKACNEEHTFTGQPPVSLTAFLISLKFWSSTLQTWQAEHLAIVAFVLLTVFLREQDSAESKPLEAGDQTTGMANERHGFSMYDTRPHHF